MIFNPQTAYLNGHCALNTEKQIDYITNQFLLEILVFKKKTY